jgi:hypothetical protein
MDHHHGKPTNPTKYFMKRENRLLGLKPPRINYMNDSWNSLLIPTLPFFVEDTDTIKEIVEKTLTIGKVAKVEMMERFAFIFFDYWFNTSEIAMFRKTIEMDGYIDVFGYKECIGLGTEETIYTDWNYCKYNDTSLLSMVHFIRFSPNHSYIPTIITIPAVTTEYLSITKKDILDLQTRIQHLENVIMKLMKGI